MAFVGGQSVFLQIINALTVTFKDLPSETYGCRPVVQARTATGQRITSQ